MMAMLAMPQIVATVTVMRKSAELCSPPLALARKEATFNEAKRVFDEAQRAFELDPGHMEACVLLGDLTFKLKQPQRARERYQRCIDQNPNSPLVKYVRSALAMIK